MSRLTQLRSGGKAALAEALSLLEREPDSAEVMELLDEAFVAATAQVIGLTGPPGVGKSTLAGAMISNYRNVGRTIGIIAVDPSSRRTGGALLGDRTRLRTDPHDQGVFVRSMAARDRLGGLADLTYGAMVLMRALYDYVLVETVGVGQSETEITYCADTIVFCVQPSSGDSLQYMKAGIAEIPDIVVVTKSDLGAPAIRAKADVKGALSLAQPEPDSWQPRVLMLSSQMSEGLEKFASALAEHWSWLGEKDRLHHRRTLQAAQWFELTIKERWGREGLAKWRGRSSEVSPFRALQNAVSGSKS